ncbi:response regulator [Sulfitobacter sp. HNIBRBA2951]|uniref:response regulator n=1 Tax=Sulfitobacter aquimarinus TaxID=3158557 RepID=UPI0032DEFFC7
MRKKILIVEDDSFTRFMMKQIIGTLDLGPDVDVAENGTSGCDLLEQTPDQYALVLMDIHMPKLSGLDATKRIRNSESDPPKNIPIYAVTADSNFHHPLAVEQYGMDGFISKPISPGDLIGLVEKYCAPAGDLDRQSTSAG